MSRHAALFFASALFVSTLAHTADVGSTPGQFSVDPAGAALYRVPIEVPPGVNGLAPTLALSYSSRAGNGLLGIGWTLSGLSAITRCAATRAQDAGLVDGVDLDANDRFCLDGQRLMVVNGAAYGAAGSEYRTEVESFQHVVAQDSAGNGPASFLVKDRAGLIREYGVTQDSRVEASGRSSVIVWAVNRIADRFGNHIRFEYGEDSITGEHWPSAVSYHNLHGSQLGRVVLNYQTPRPDPRSGYLADNTLAGGNAAITSVMRRMSSIEVYGRASLVRRYRLDYESEPTTRRSQLTAITQCDAAGRCLPPTTFAWQRATLGTYDNVYHTLSASVSQMRLADIDADGAPDQVFVANGRIRVRRAWGATAEINTGISSTGKALQYALVGDYDGDGDQDLLVPNTSTSRWDLFRSTVTNLVRVDTNRGLLGVSTNLARKGGYGFLRGWTRSAALIDVDGDARPELAFRYQNRIWFYRNGLNGLQANPVDTGVGAKSEANLHLIEFNGDGRPDLYLSTCSDCFPAAVLLSNGSTLTSAGAVGQFNWNVRFLDVNADGLTDAAYPRSFASPFAWELHVNRGAQWGQTWVGEGVLVNSDADVLDYNLDGRSDLMVAYGGYFQVLISAGETFEPQRPTNIGASGSPFFLDYNGDGLADLLRLNGADLEVRAHPGLLPGLVSKVTDGLGASVEIEYIALSAKERGIFRYQGHSTDGVPAAMLASGEVASLAAPVTLVRTFATDTASRNSAGAEQKIFTQYSYQGAKVSNWGRGFLGFSKVESFNSNTGHTTRNFLRQDHPYTGMVERAELVAPDAGVQNITASDYGAIFNEECRGLNGTYQAPDLCEPPVPRPPPSAPLSKLSETINTLDRVVLGTGSGRREFPFVSRAASSSHDLPPSGALFRRVVSDFLHDEWGNAYDITVTTSADAAGTDTHVVRTQNEFDNSPAWTGSTKWCLGRLMRSTVTRTRPAYPGSGNQAPLSALRQTRFTYDPERCQLTSETLEPDSAWQLVRSYEFDAFGNRVRETVGGARLGTRSQRSDYDALGQFPETLTNAKGHITRQYWEDRFGAPFEIVDPNGQLTRIGYDDLGRKRRQSATPESIFTDWAYEWCGVGVTCENSAARYATIELQSNGLEAIEERDKLGRVITRRVRGFDGRFARQDEYFDAAGRNYASSLPYFPGEAPCWTFRRFDAFGRVTEERRPAHESQCGGLTPPPHDQPPLTSTAVSTHAYSGLTSTHSDPQSRQTVRVLNAADRLRIVREWDDIGPIETVYDYDAFGNRSWVRDAAGNQTHATFNVRGFRDSLTDPDMGRWLYDYDELGELIAQTDANGNSATLRYDVLGRLDRRIEREGTTTWTYDAYDACTGSLARGKLARVVAPDGYEERYCYDGVFGRLTDTVRRIDGVDYVVSQTYDALGRVETIIYPESAAPRPPNVAPVAVASAPASASVGSAVALTGSNSHDPDSGPQALQFAWSQTAGPTTPVQNAAAANASFVPPADATYGFRLTVSDGIDIATAAVTVNAGTPTPGIPASISVPLEDADGAYTVSWTGASGPVTAYELYEARAGDFSDATLLYAGGALSYGTAGRAAGDWFYRVRACNGGMCSAYRTAANPARVLPIAPGAPGPISFSFIPGYQQTSYRVSWGAASGTVTRYELQEANNAAFAGAWLLGVSGSTYADIIEQAGGSWWYRVRACNGVSCSGYTAGGPKVVRFEVPRAVDPEEPDSGRDSQEVAWREVSALRWYGSSVPTPRDWLAAAGPQYAFQQVQLAPANRLRVRYEYNTYGHLERAVNDADRAQVYWQNLETDGAGRALRERYGSQLTTTHDFDRASGTPTEIKSIGASNATLQHEQFEWDLAGNLLIHRDLLAQRRDEFGYDPLYRVESASTFNAPFGGSLVGAARNYSYDAIGNLRSNEHFSSLSYGASQPHAVKSASNGSGTRNYTYDANGNLASVAGAGARTLAWYSFNLPSAISDSSGQWSQFWYAPDRSRFKQTSNRAGAAQTTLYVGGAFEKTTGPSGTQFVHYILAGGHAVALVKRTAVGIEQLNFLLRDHQGNVTAVATGNGALLETLSYDGWGKRRNPSTWQSAATGSFLTAGATPRGYTSHEHLDHVGLIHMNGRVYDPEIGRFISADPFVQFPDSTQGLNRYSYVLNNPASYVDPSGHSLLVVWKILAAAIGSQIEAAAGQMIYAAIVGYASTGEAKGALTAVVSAGLAHGVGELFGHNIGYDQFGMLLAKAAVHGVTQGAVMEIGGGDFGEGFLGAFAGSVGGPAVGAIESSVVQTIVAAVIGGTAAELGGGSFANGAASAAFVHVFNELNGLPCESRADCEIMRRELSHLRGETSEEELREFYKNQAVGAVNGLSLVVIRRPVVNVAAAGGTQGLRTGTIVLGRFPEYKDYAKAIGGNYFDIGRLWRVLNDRIVWKWNRWFLDRAVARGDDIVLSKPFDPSRDAASWLAREVAYLETKYGYHISSDGLRMVLTLP